MQKPNLSVRAQALRRVFLLSLAIVSPAAAVRAAQECVLPISPNAVDVRQPDGRTLALHFRGNAFRHWYEDAHGFPVLPSEAGYVYAELTADGSLRATRLLAGSVDPREHGLHSQVVPQRSPLGLIPLPSTHKSAQQTAPGVSGSVHPAPGGSLFAGAGSVKNLVLLLRFSNHGPAGQNRTLPTAANVNTIMNAVGGDPVLAPTGSVRDHYLQTSYGQFTIDSVATGWLAVPGTESYYTNGNSGLTTRTWELITDGLNLADATVDFTQYDQDGDGWVDAITFLHSGYGAEWGGTDQYGTNYVDRMWSHKWEIPVWTSAEGVKVGDYNISPGLWSTSGSAPGRIGVVCHELGHFFGLPDLYDTDGSSQGIGNWCLMAAGSWSFDGSQQNPSHMSAWAKLKLGWVTPQVLLPGVYSAAQVELSPAVFRIDSGYPPGEYLLLENRQPTGFDAVIPQGGLAIWHVDEGKGSLTNNSPNNAEGYPGQSGWPGNANHYRVALLQADSGFDMEHGFDRGDSGDVYRSGGVTVLDGGTTPNSNAYQGGTTVANGNRIQSIGVSGATMSFTYASPSAPTITTATAPDAAPGVPYSLSLASSGGTAPKTWSEFRDNPAYALTDLGAGSFALGGVSQGWNADDQVWTLTLPFAFPYYERSYTKVYVSSNGFVDLAPTDAEAVNRPDWLRGSLRIAPLWDDLRTDLGGQGIFVDTSVGGQVRIRWAAESFNSGSPCNVALVLFSDGRIRFEYGSGNQGLTPNVGISRGHSADCILPPTHDRQASLQNANKLLFTLTGSQIPPGLSLSSAGVLSGTPTTMGTFQPRFRVTDNAFRYHERVVTIEVVPLAFCFGDGSAASCPCGNSVTPGSGQGCQNSTGIGAILSASGTTQPNTLVLTCAGVPTNELCTLVESSANASPGGIVGDGIGCLGAVNPQRAVKKFAEGGAVSFGVHSAPPGQMRFYQVSYRDPAALFCPPATTNRSNALQILW